MPNKKITNKNARIFMRFDIKLNVSCPDDRFNLEPRIRRISSFFSIFVSIIFFLLFSLFIFVATIFFSPRSNVVVYGGAMKLKPVDHRPFMMRTLNGLMDNKTILWHC